MAIVQAIEDPLWVKVLPTKTRLNDLRQGHASGGPEVAATPVLRLGVKRSLRVCHLRLDLVADPLACLR
jgi:hypothetical protein